MNALGRITWNPRRTVERELTGAETISWVDKPTLWPILLETAIGVSIALLVAGYGAWFHYKFSAGYPPTANAVTKFVFSFAIPTLFGVFGVFAALHAVFRLSAIGRTAYAITDRRLLIVSDLLWRRVTSYAPSLINVVERKQHRDGSGTVVFRRVRTYRHTARLAFVGVRDARHVSEEIKRLWTESGGRSGHQG